MKSLKLIAVLFAVILLVSCGAQQAKDFNDKLVGIQMSLMNEVNGMKSDTADALGKLTKVQNAAKAKIAEAKALEGPKDGEGFRQAMINDFDGIVGSYGVLINMLKQQGNDEELKKLQDEFDGWQKKIEVLDENVMAEQKKFVAKYNIKLENK
jgi:peptidoglycan hydrolase CwlO-like protein